MIFFCRGFRPFFSACTFFFDSSPDDPSFCHTPPRPDLLVLFFHPPLFVVLWLAPAASSILLYTRTLLTQRSRHPAGGSFAPHVTFPARTSRASAGLRGYSFLPNTVVPHSPAWPAFRRGGRRSFQSRVLPEDFLPFVRVRFRSVSFSPFDLYLISVFAFPPPSPPCLNAAPPCTFLLRNPLLHCLTG